ncbi:MAG TPA: hypothetical protein VGI58_14620, partial [Streptosporangiaceae bacterium]
DPHYAKLAYSSHTAPGTAEAAWRADVDNHIAVLAADDTPTRRLAIERIAVAGDQARSRYTAMLAGSDTPCVIETAVLARGPFEIRAHLVQAPPGLTVRDGGYAVAGSQAAGGPVAGEPPQAIAVGADGLASVIIGLHGWAEAGVRAEPEANAYGPRPAVPYLLSAPREHAETVHVSLVVLTGDAVYPEPLAVDITAEVDGRRVLVRLPGGDAELRLG